jgi:hypothetical protein
LFWNLIFSNIINKNNLSIEILQNKNLNKQLDKKIKIIFNQLSVDKQYSTVIIKEYLNNFKYSLNLSKIKLNYSQIIISKNAKQKKHAKIVYMYILLLKKQTYINIFVNNKKIHHNTNGIVLKKHNILEKSRKKDPKSSILNLNNSINFFKNLNINSCLVINIKKIKPFINKINKILKNEFNQKDVKFVISPEISFNKKVFKKIKSIKRRLRKKYNVFDV